MFSLMQTLLTSEIAILCCKFVEGFLGETSDVCTSEWHIAWVLLGH